MTTKKHGRICSLDKENFRNLKDAVDHLDLVASRLNKEHRFYKEITKVSTRILSSDYWNWLVINNVRAAKRKPLVSLSDRRRRATTL